MNEEQNKKEFELCDGDRIVRFEETNNKKQMLWDAFIDWCKEHDSFNGECMQNDNFNIDAPEFMATAIDRIVMFKTEWRD